MFVTKEYSDYISFLEKYRDELVLVLSNEREKHQALMDSDIERLEAMLQFQQAETMKLKSFEHKRLSMQEDMGFKDCGAKEIIEAVGGGEPGNRLRELFDQMSDLAVRIKHQNALAIERANENLRMLDTILKSSDFDTGNNVYGPESGRSPKYSKESAFEKMV